MPKYSICVLLFLNLLFCSVMGQSKSVFYKDNSPVNLRSFDTKALKEYRAERLFDYDETKKNFYPSLWERFWNWFWDLFSELISSTKSSVAFNYLFIGLGCAALIFLIVRLSGMEASSLFSGNSKEIALPYHENPENIHHISFDNAISNALKDNDYRFAVRMLYLKSLKRLSDSGRIIWQPEKTNATYIGELRNLSQKEKFKVLTQRFEYVWYGRFPVDDEAYNKISQLFNEFNSTR